QKYGADTGRLYTLFAAPPEKDLEWSEESIEGSWRFLNRVYRLVERHALAVQGVKRKNTDASAASPKEKFLLRKVHQTLGRVTQDFETRWHFNSAIALVMELTNEIYLQEPLEKVVRPEVRREVLELLTLMLAPMTPHLAEELWEMLGHSGGLWKASWPAFDEALTREHGGRMKAELGGVVVLDFGGQYTQLIARRIREQQVFSAVLPCTSSIEEIRKFAPAGIVLSGGPSSVYDSEAPKCDPKVLALGIPVLGICYGMQWITHTL